MDRRVPAWSSTSKIVCQPGFRHERKENVDAGAPPLAALNIDGTAGLIHDATDRGQAKTRALARLFRGEKRFKKVGLRRLIHAAAFVLNADQSSRFPFAGNCRTARGDRDSSATRHSVTSVQHEIEEHLAQLCLIGEHWA
jgi:hypothetical protein